MENDKISFFHKIHYSIAKLDKYPMMVKEGIGRALVYLLLITLIFGTIGGIVIAVDVYQLANTFKTEDIEGLPYFEFVNGELEIEGDMPIIIEEDRKSIYIIDVSGETTADILDNYDKGLLILKDRVIQKENNKVSAPFYYSQFQGITFDKEDFIKLVDTISGLLIVGIILIIIFSILLFYLGRMISALILALIGLIITSIQKTSVSFSKLYSIGIYVLTFPIILKVTLSIFDYNLGWYLYYGIAGIYLWVAIKFEKESTQEEPPIE